jgi:uroporphyrinogen-III synthase
MRNIVLTRPIAQSQSLAKQLEVLGYSVALFPLLEIASLPEHSDLQIKLQISLKNLNRYAMAAFVSPNAIHAVFQCGLQWPDGVSIAVLGEGSRAALAQYGINDKNTRIYSPTDPLKSDSETLLQNLNLPALKGHEVVIFRAETGRELLADALTSHEIKVDKVIAYRRFAPTLTEQRSRQLMGLLTDSSRWVVSSSEALRTLEDMVIKSGGEDGVVKMHQVNLWVSHQRIAQIAEKSGFKHVHLIGLGDENILLALQSRL